MIHNCLLMVTTGFRKPVSSFRIRRTAAVLPVALACAGLLLAGSLWTPAARAAEGNQRLDIYFIDVEGGAATLIITPAGESLLIDSGYPDYGGRDRDRILKVAREVAGLKRIDHAIVSHWHLDHYGNHAALSTEIPIGTFWDRGIPDALIEDDKFVERIALYRAASQNESRTLKAGDKLPLEQSGETPVEIEVLTASRQVVPNRGEPNPFAERHRPRTEDRSDNAASLTLLLKFGGFRFLCCGDLTWNIEAKLVTPRNSVGTVDLFMVTHHGLPSSNNPALVLAIDPVVAVMCNGPTKGGHPDTIATLRQVQSLQRLYQLHRNVKLSADEQTPSGFIANTGTTEGCQGVFVKTSVAQDGKAFTVQIGEKGRARIYDSHRR